jgi:hypothetical protein
MRPHPTSELPESVVAHSVERLVMHLVMFSGGVCSWAAAKRVVEQHGAENTVLLFADTKMEDEDLYRFLHEAAANVGAPLVRIADGRTPWEVMRDHNCIAKPRMDMCSRELKRELLDKWRNEHCVPDATVHLGISWDEAHRLEKVRALCAPWHYEAPMCDAPYLSKAQMLDALKGEGICPPRLYAMGFPHNNCGGFCVKAGQAHFAHLLRMMPDRYRYHEAKEEEMRQRVGDYSILRDRTGGTTKTLTLRTLRERIEAQGEFDVFEWGGCGCSIDA